MVVVDGNVRVRVFLFPWDNIRRAGGPNVPVSVSVRKRNGAPAQLFVVRRHHASTIVNRANVHARRPSTLLLNRVIVMLRVSLVNP